MAERKDLSAEEKLYIHYGSDHFNRNKFKKAENTKLGIKPEYGLRDYPVKSQHGWNQW